MQNQCYLNVLSKCILNALRIRTGNIATGPNLICKPTDQIYRSLRGRPNLLKNSSKARFADELQPKSG